MSAGEKIEIVFVEGVRERGAEDPHAALAVEIDDLAAVLVDQLEEDAPRERLEATCAALRVRTLGLVVRLLSLPPVEHLE